MSPGIFMITEQGLVKSLKGPANIFAIPGKDGLIYDAGYGDRRSIRRAIEDLDQVRQVCESRGEPFGFTRILISHAHEDHFSGMARLRKRLGVKIMVTEKMAGIISSRRAFMNTYLVEDVWERKGLQGWVLLVLKKCMKTLSEVIFTRFFGMSFITDPDEIISENCSISINSEDWEVFPSPGHSDDHISLYNRKRGVLLGGDNILRTINTWLGPPKSDIRAYIRTLEKIGNLPGLEIVLPAHGAPVNDPSGRIAELVQWRTRRIDEIYDMVAGSAGCGVSGRQLMERLYPGGGWVKRYLGSGWVKLTLQLLVDEGRLSRKGAGKDALYSANGKRKN